MTLSGSRCDFDLFRTGCFFWFPAFVAMEKIRKKEHGLASPQCMWQHQLIFWFYVFLRSLLPLALMACVANAFMAPTSFVPSARLVSSASRRVALRGGAADAKMLEITPNVR
jgi:hypothetical protein